MKYLIFDDNANGHHIEYLNHITENISNVSDNEYIFLISPKFKEKWELLEWNKISNISYIYISDEDINHISTAKNRFSKSKRLSKILAKAIKLYKPDKVILINIIPFLPFLPLYIHKNRLINGIIYKVPRYRPNNSRFVRLRDILIMNLFVKSSIFNKVFLLNDEESPNWYNSKYKTKNFDYLPDPINIDESKTLLKYNKCSDKIILTHGGGLTERKGTFVFLEALNLLTDDQRKRFKIRLIGSAKTSDERKKIITFIDNNKESLDIYFSDQFVSFENLLNEINNSDYIIIPYYNWEQSSGLLGYAAYCKRPVIGPSKGLLGNLIFKYELGITLEEISSKALSNLLLKLDKNYKYHNSSSVYVQSRTKFNFVNKLLNS